MTFLLSESDMILSVFIIGDFGSVKRRHNDETKNSSSRSSGSWASTDSGGGTDKLSASAR